MADLLQALPLAAALAAVAYFTTASPPSPVTVELKPEPSPKPKRTRPLRFIDYYSRLQLLEMAAELRVGTPGWRQKASKQRLYAALLRAGVSHG